MLVLSVVAGGIVASGSDKGVFAGGSVSIDRDAECLDIRDIDSEENGETDVMIDEFPSHRSSRIRRPPDRAIARNPKDHPRTKHIDVKYHFIRDAIARKRMDVVYCPTGDMVADTLTKSLAKPKFEKFRKLMGVVSI